MIDLDINVSLRITISDWLNARLENGEERAFEELESRLLERLNEGIIRPTTLAGELQRTGGYVSRLEIQDAGPHNVSWKDESSSKEEPIDPEYYADFVSKCVCGHVKSRHDMTTFWCADCDCRSFQYAKGE